MNKSKLKILSNKDGENIIQIDMEDLVDLDELYLYKRKADEKLVRINKIQIKTPNRIFDIECEYV
jgi:hypothetical protein